MMIIGGLGDGEDDKSDTQHGSGGRSGNASPETAHRKCYPGAGEAAACLNVLGGLDRL